VARIDIWSACVHDIASAAGALAAAKIASAVTQPPAPVPQLDSVAFEKLKAGDVVTTGHVVKEKTAAVKNRAKKPAVEKDGGFAAYQSMPAILANEVQFSRPHIRMSADGTKKTVAHRVQLATPVVASTTGFAVVYDAVIQPGMTMGSWLAAEASGWEQYVVRVLRFHWVSIQGTNVAGDINMIIDYNPLGETVESVEVASQFQDMVQGSVFVPHTLVARQKDLMSATGKRKWVRTAVDFVGDRKTYDCGRFTLASEGVTATPGDRLGKLWVDFVIDFYVPQAPSEMSVGFCRAAQFVLNANLNLPTSSTTNVTAWTSRTNNIGIEVDGSGLFTLPRGCYMVQLRSNYEVTVALNNQTVAFSTQLNGTAISNQYGVGAVAEAKALSPALGSTGQFGNDQWVLLDLGGPLFEAAATRQFTVQVVTPAFGGAGTAQLNGNVTIARTRISFLRIDE
jgi:hypothetical protein